MNIAEILKDCPEGTKLWSPICGDCTLREVKLSLTYPIMITSVLGTDSFTEEGRYLSDKAGECLLFPSKENRDWTKFHQNNYKPGDFVYFKAEYDWICLFKGRRDGMVCTFLSYDPENQEIYGLSSDRNYLCAEDEVKTSRLATEQEKAEVLKALAEKGLTWDAKNLKVVKKAHEFKPYDRVLVRDTDSREWRCAIFSHISLNKNYFGKYVTEISTWKQCIPFEGNEHLVGTTDSPD